MKFLIPSLSKLLRASKPWSLERSFWEGRWHWDDYPQQRTAPAPRGLLGKLGIRRRENVVCLAAFRANWALALAQAGAKVSYTDLSGELTRHVGRHVKHKNLVESKRKNYVLFPDKTSKYDWSFSFEALGPKSFILFRALLNKRGGKYVVWDESVHAKRKLHQMKQTLSLCKRFYGSSGSVKRKLIYCMDRLGVWAWRPHIIVTVNTSAESRKRTVLDLRVVRHLDRHRKVFLTALSRRFKVSESAVKGSLKRLAAWSKFLLEYTKQVTIS